MDMLHRGVTVVVTYFLYIIVCSTHEYHYLVYIIAILWYSYSVCPGKPNSSQIQLISLLAEIHQPISLNSV